MTSQNPKGKTPEPVASVSDETLLKISKEIAVKFIEVGRMTPASFNEQFSEIYNSIASTVRKN